MKDFEENPTTEKEIIDSLKELGYPTTEKEIIDSLKIPTDADIIVSRAL